MAPFIVSVIDYVESVKKPRKLVYSKLILCCGRVLSLIWLTINIKFAGPIFVRNFSLFFNFCNQKYVSHNSWQSSEPNLIPIWKSFWIVWKITTNMVSYIWEKSIFNKQQQTSPVILTKRILPPFCCGVYKNT